MSAQPKRSKGEASESVSLCQSCIAGGLGAFVLAIGDLGRNDTRLLNVQEVLTKLGLSHGDDFLVPVLLVVCLGVVVAWVYRPRLRVDAFLRGLSVFAIIGTATPATSASELERGSPLEPTDSSSVAPAAPAAVHPSSITWGGGQKSHVGKSARAVFSIRGATKNTVALVTVRNADDGRIVARERVEGSRFRIERTVGRYVVEYEAKGYRRVQFKLSLERNGTYTFGVTKTSVPLAIQRLASPETITLQAVGAGLEGSDRQEVTV